MAPLRVHIDGEYISFESISSAIWFECVAHSIQAISIRYQKLQRKRNDQK